MRMPAASERCDRPRAAACGALTHRAAHRFLLWENRVVPTCTAAVPRSTCTLLLINSVVLFTYCGDIAQHLHVPTAVPRITCTLLRTNSVVLFTYYGIPSQHTRAAGTFGLAVVYSCETHAQHLQPPPRILAVLCWCLLRADFVAVLTVAHLVRSSSAPLRV
jgi:hypothetical protein